MKNRISFFGVLLILAVVILTNSCKHKAGGNCGGETNISKNNGHSHNAGQNCMNCHNGKGDASGCFYAAGTVYDSLNTTTIKNGIVKLYTGINASGVLKATIEIDGRGNFHTTDAISYSGGLYPTVTSATGAVKNMNSKITSGACNSCHGSSTNKIWVN